jgi:hypothetical protein
LDGKPATFSAGFEERIRLHELQLARLTSLRLVEEHEQTAERWSKRRPLGEAELARRERLGLPDPHYVRRARVP